MIRAIAFGGDGLAADRGGAEREERATQSHEEAGSRRELFFEQNQGDVGRDRAHRHEDQRRPEPVAATQSAHADRDRGERQQRDEPPFGFAQRDQGDVRRLHPEDIPPGHAPRGQRQPTERDDAAGQSQPAGHAEPIGPSSHPRGAYRGPAALTVPATCPYGARGMETRIAVLASGAGTNLQALLEDAVVGPRIRLVVSDRADAKALRRAEDASVRAVHLDPAAHASREAYDLALQELLRAEADAVCLAGFMRILGAPLVRAFAGRMLNVHPSLLPSFPGAHAVRDALEWGAKITGVTVHLVDEEVDHGPIVLQEAVPVLDGDDERSLHARIQEVEHRLYPAAARLLAEGRLKVDGRRVVEGRDGGG